MMLTAATVFQSGVFSSGRCAPGTDWLDCDPCGSFKEDGQCDTPGGGSWFESCDPGTDFIDCNKEVAESCGWLPLCKTYKTELACERNEYRGCDWEEGRSRLGSRRRSVHHGRLHGECEYDRDVSRVAGRHLARALCAPIGLVYDSPRGRCDLRMTPR